MVAALGEAAVDPASAAVLGSGATARSSVVALLRAGARRIVVSARRESAAAELRDRVDPSVCSVEVVPWGDPAALVAGLVVSTVPAGAADALAGSVPQRPGALFDVVYDPWPTALASAWAERGGAVLGGMDLLVHQAALQVELMTGRRPDVAAMRAAGEAALASR
jgi:shikimate dehydrogenase